MFIGTLAGASGWCGCGRGVMFIGTLAGASGWCGCGRGVMFIGTLAGASGWCDERPRLERAASVSLTMIVKDEQENLPRCLASIAGIFDEIIVVDTGSTDRTREIAREFGAKVFDFVWVDSFAAARNEALAHATGTA